MFCKNLTRHLKSRDGIHVIRRSSDKEYPLNVMLLNKMRNQFTHALVIAYTY